jgi:hypothetical protein
MRVFVNMVLGAVVASGVTAVGVSAQQSPAPPTAGIPETAGLTADIGFINIAAAKSATETPRAERRALEVADITLIADPAKSFVVIMKDGVIYKNALESRGTGR